MASTSKSSIQFLGHVINRRRTAQQAFHHQFQQIDGSSRRLSSRCRKNCSRTRQCSSTAAFPQRWDGFQQYRYFTSTVDRKIHSNLICVNDGNRLFSSDSDGAKNDDNKSQEPDSLHSNVHYILKIPYGRMSDGNLSKARAFLSIVSKWNNENGAKLSEALLERLYKEQSRRNKHILLDSEMYNICMDAWNKSNADGETIVHRVESIMKRMEDRFFLGSQDNDGYDKYSSHDAKTARPDRYSYNCLINSYTKWEEEDSSKKVEAILEKMNDLAEDAASSENAIEREYESLVRPDTFTFHSLMNYYATRKNDHLAAQRAEDLLLQMSELSQQGDGNIQMETTSFNIVMKAWSNSGGGINGAQRAESILRMMIRLYGRGHENVRPDTVSFSTVIGSYSKVEDPEDASLAIEKVMELLDELEGSYIPDSDTNINSCYNAAANAIVKIGAKDAAGKVKDLMNRMNNMDAIPDSKLITSFIEAHAKEGTEESIRQGRDLLLEMIEKKDPELKASFVVPFNILLDSILKGDSVNKLEMAEELLAAMENVGGTARPDVKSYNMIISALSRSSAKGSEQRAMDHLRSMLKAYRDGYEEARPDSFAFNCTISMLARSQQGEWADDVIYKTLKAMESQQKHNTNVKPDTITYNLVIGRLSQTYTKQNAKKVMNLLTSMEQKMESNEAIAPDIITYTAALRIQSKVDPLRAADIAASYVERATSNGDKFQVDRHGFQALLLALSKSSKLDHAMLALKIWSLMENSDRSKENVLDADLCNLVLIALSRTDDARAAVEALSFLSERIRRYNEGEKTMTLPTVVGFSAALASLGKANRIEDVFRLLKIMKVLGKDGAPNVQPDDGCYNSILIQLARSHANDEAMHALRVIQHMNEDLKQISTASLNSSINACSRTSQTASSAVKLKAVDIALQIFRLGKESKSCDAITYGLMVRTCIRLIEDDNRKLKLVKHMFKLCANSGLVGNMVMREIEPFKRKIIANDKVLAEWSINAKDC